MQRQNMKDRNFFPPDHCLNPGLFSNWSTWIVIMSPFSQAGFVKRKTQGYRSTNVGRCVPMEPGMYELALYVPKTKQMQVVYLGRSGSLLSRLLDYCYTGSHNSDKIYNQLWRGFEICVRYFTTANGNIWEPALLQQYNYDWNQRTPKIPKGVPRSTTKRYDPRWPEPEFS